MIFSRGIIPRMKLDDVKKVIEARYKSARFWGVYANGKTYWGIRGGFVSFEPETNYMTICQGDRKRVVHF